MLNNFHTFMKCIKVLIKLNYKQLFYYLQQKTNDIIA